MKKSLLAVALLGTFAASAFAAPSVTLYGRIDTGLAYTHLDTDQANVDSTDTFTMESGFSTGSRWGLKGTEDIGNVKVGFVLESGFTSDDGKSAQGGRLFGREALVSVSGKYGTLYAGRMLSLATDGGSIGLLGATSVFGNAYGVATMKGSTGSDFARYDNTLAYVTPAFGGFKGEVMYSFKADSGKAGTENKADADRYAAAGLQYKAGAFTGVLTAEYTMWGNTAYKDLDDGVAVIVGGNYNFGPAQVFAKATWFDNQASVADTFSLINKNGAKAIEGWGAEIGAKVPAFGGAFVAGVGYRDAEAVNNNAEFTRWNAGVGYLYSFSKRTNVYGAVAYAQEKAKNGVDSRTPSEVQVGAGIVHKF